MLMVFDGFGGFVCVFVVFGGVGCFGGCW